MLLSQHKVYVIGGNAAIERIFQDVGAQNVHSIADASIVCWTGGSDVSPDLYKELKHPTTNNDPARDKWEAALFAEAQYRRKTLCVGICRGGQFLNVMNGGSLWQDVDNHAIGGTHPLIYELKISNIQTLSRQVEVTSTHHQMMIPNMQFSERGQVWAWAGLATRKAAGIRMKGGSGEQWVCVEPKPGHQSDCEIVFYPKTRSLCFQPHPEYNSKSTRDLFFNCVERALAA